MVLICHVTSKTIIKAMYDFMIRSLSEYITILANLVAGDIMVLLCHVIS